MACTACAKTREQKAAQYVSRALSLLREATAHDGVERDTCINRLSEAAQLLPEVPASPVKPAKVGKVSLRELAAIIQGKQRNEETASNTLTVLRGG